MRLYFYSAILVCYSLSISNCTSKSSTPAEVRPNIVLVMADDQGWGDMAYNGHPVLKTPHFDDMAATTLRFDRFYAAASVCSPTRGSVMTGRHPNRFECFTWGHTLRPEEITIAEALKGQGYVTGHFGKWHLGPVRQGSPLNPGASGFDEWFSAPNFFDNDPILSREGIAIKTKGESSIVTVNAALEFIQKYHQSDKPYLAVVWFGSPHGPHEAYDEDRLPYATLDENLQHFYGEITGMDRAFGKLRQEVRNLPHNENTLIWYCSDNGGLPRVGATGGRGQKGQVYEGGLRVPAMLEWPARITKASNTKVLCNTSDIYPTLLEITGTKIANQPPLDGISLLPLIDGKMNTRPNAMGFWNYPTQGVRTPSKEWMAELYEAQQAGNMTGDSTRLRLHAGKISNQYPLNSFTGHAAWLDWPWKLHRIEKTPDDIKYELYQLQQDSMETNDLIATQPEQAEALKPALSDWQRSLIKSMNGEDYYSN